jgi:hypothetical protein
LLLDYTIPSTSRGYEAFPELPINNPDVFHFPYYYPELNSVKPCDELNSVS